ncbi:MAG TPA: ECF transporter S component [Candidatus Cloacimonadota bacterium]|nr:ECF transporter S component [Candidatus Cloacimonadota bacterium]
MKNYLMLILAGVVAASTFLIRIPIPVSGGYLNFGDIAVVFCGLYLGKTRGALAGGIGSAIADLIGGYFIFIPITFVAKGLEAFLAGVFVRRNPLFLAFGAIAMLAVYFLAELFIPGMGLPAALADLNFNIIQALSGAIGGRLLFLIVEKALPGKLA